MFAVRPFYFNESGSYNYNQPILMADGAYHDFGNHLITYSIGGPFNEITAFHEVVPVASSIESTMEWCDRVARKHHWVDDYAAMLPDLPDVVDSGGFIWKTLDGHLNDIRLIPQATEPYSFQNYSTRASGFYLNYRDIVQFMGMNNLQNWTSSGNTWPNMGSVITWPTNSSFFSLPKLARNHFDSYIYHGSPQTPSWHFGTAAHSKYYPLSLLEIGLHSGWDVPKEVFESGAAVQLSYWGTNSYENSYNGERLSPSLLTTYINSPEIFGREQTHCINTYKDHLVPPNIYYYVNGAILPFPEPGYIAVFSGFHITQIEHGFFDGVNAGFGLSKFGLRQSSKYYRYYDTIGGSMYYSGGLQYDESFYSFLIESIFSYSYTSLNPINLVDTEVNKKLVHIIGVDDSDYSLYQSGKWANNDVDHTEELFIGRSGITVPFPGTWTDFLIPVPDARLKYQVENIWEGNFRLAFGFANFYSNYNENSKANVIASKIREGQYTTIAELNVSQPTIGSLSWMLTSIFDGPLLTSLKSSLTYNNGDASQIFNTWSSGDNTVFYVLFYNPFEGSGITPDAYFVDPDPLSPIDIYSVPSVSPYTVPQVYTVTDGWALQRRGAFISKQNQFTGMPVPPSSFSLSPSVLTHSTTWW